MIRLMLTCHSEICIPPEGPFGTSLVPRYGSERDWSDEKISEFVKAVLGWEKSENWKLEEQALVHYLRTLSIETYGQAVSGVYQFYMSVNEPDAVHWGDKSGTVSLRYLGELCAQLPDCRFVHIVRDGRDVLCSYRGANGKSGPHAPKLPEDPFDAAWQWSGRVNSIDSFLKQFETHRVHVVRYEDLTSNPQKYLSQVCEFLNLDFEPAMLEFGKRNAELELEPKSFLQWKSKTTEAVSDSQVERWKQELTLSEIRKFELIAGPTLARFGYQRESESTPLGIRCLGWKRLCQRKYSSVLNRVFRGR